MEADKLHTLGGTGVNRIMRLSRASTYAVYGMSYLASQAPGRLVPLSEIRIKWDLPEKHLAKIFNTLVRSGHLRSERGVHGGFALAKPASSISALDIIYAVDGRGRHGECPIHPSAREDSGCCPIQKLVFEGRREMERMLGKASLAELAQPALFRNVPSSKRRDHT